MAANNIYIQVDFNSQTAQQNVNALNTAIANTGPVAEKSAKRADESLKSVGVTIKQVNSEFQQMTAALAGLGIARAFENMSRSAEELNRVQLAMRAMTDSGEEAKKLFDDIRAVAAQGPFKMKDLEESARQLLGFGFAAKNIPNILQTITDQVARMGNGMEDVNGIVTLFGRMMEKNFVGAKDAISKLPGEGIPVLKQLAAEMEKTLGHPVDTQAAKAAIQEGLIEPLQMVRIALDAMKPAAGFGKGIFDFGQQMKTLGDAWDELKRKMFSEEGFGKALNKLAEEIGGVMAVFAGFLDMLMKLPEPTKELLVHLAAAAAALTAFGTALGIVINLGGPLAGFVKTLATFIVELAVMNPELAAIAVAIGAIGVAAYKLIPAFQGFVDKIGDKIKGIFAGLTDEAKQFFGDFSKSAGQPIQPGEVMDKMKLWNEKALPEIQKFSAEANKVLLGALESPVEAVRVKYTELFAQLKAKLEDPKQLFNLTDAQKEAMKQALGGAQATEMLAAQLKEDQKLRDERIKADAEHVKASYQAQIAYIEALDVQDLHQKVAAIDRITDLRIASAQKVAAVENAGIQQTYDAYIQTLKDHREELTALGLDVNGAIDRLTKEMLQKQGENTRKATDEEQQYRLEGWKKANDAIIEDQKRIFESFKSVFDQIFDAITNKNPGKAMADVFKKLMIDQAKDLFSSQAAGLATAAAGYGYPEGGITRGSGILSQLLQHGMPPRPMMAAPEGYNPAKSETGISYGDVVQTNANTANRMDISANLYNDATVRFALAVGQFTAAGGGAQSSQGERDRIDTRGDVGSAITQASVATGVPESLLRAVAQTESHMDPSLTSRKGAAGLFQLMPATQQDWGVTNPFDPFQSAMGGAQQLKRLLAHYGGNVPLALAGYNWGMGNVDKALARGGSFPEETQKYVKKITALLSSTQGGADTGGADFAGAGGRSGGGGASGGWGVFQYPPSGGIAAPAAAEMGEPPTAFPTFGAPGFQLPMAWSIPEVARPTTAASQQTGILGALGPLLGIGGKGGMTLDKLKDLFGIGATTAGGTTVGTVLGSKGVGMLAGMAGMMLLSQGLQKRSAPVTVAGGALAGLGIGNQLGMGYGQGLMMGAGGGLMASGLQRGGFLGMGMDVAGGALAGAAIGSFLPGVGTLIGAAVGAGVGLIAGAVRMFIQTEQEKIRAQVKQVYGIDISNRQILGQIQQIVDQNYGGNVAVGVRSQEVQNLVRLYALSTGQAANMPRPMYNATIAQSTGGLQIQPVYQGGQLVQNPYTGVTTYQYQTAVAEAQGLMPNPGSGLGVPGGAWLQSTILSTIRQNPAAVTMAAANGASAGDSRLSTTQAMQEPLTALG